MSNSNTFPQILAESNYCAGSISVNSGTLISASAIYEKFLDQANGLTTVASAPIRFAEVQVFDSSGRLIQCGETDSAGQIGSTQDWKGLQHGSQGIFVPTKPGNYRLVVNSRGQNSFVQASVLNNPYSNQVYSISTAFSLTGNESSLSVKLSPASHKGSLEGGAFNILDQIVNANNFLRGNTSCPFCTNFTVAPKVNVYWTPGLSPGNYLGDASMATSFFNRNPEPGFPVGMYLLGGMNGSVCTDTDHFDNSVIVHEYGHFMEYSYNHSDSPGGSHDGNSVIDPRLAWSEGWADYFQAAVLGRSFYRDTVSNAECGTASLAFPDFVLFAQTANQDVPQNSGEGTFRELATSRSLFKASSSYPFSLIWNTFSDTQIGMANSGNHFKNPGLFFQQLMANVTGTQRGNSAWNLDVELNQEDQNTNQSSYALPVSPSSKPCTDSNASEFNFPKGSAVVSGDGAFPLRSNRYFQFYWDGNPARSKINLHYTSAAGSPYDLDLYVYQENYIFGDNSSLRGRSSQNFPEPGGDGAWPGFESVSLRGQPAGYYMIDVVSYVVTGGTGNTTNFYLQMNDGEYLCPQ